MIGSSGSFEVIDPLLNSYKIVIVFAAYHFSNPHFGLPSIFRNGSGPHSECSDRGGSRATPAEGSRDRIEVGFIRVRSLFVQFERQPVRVGEEREPPPSVFVHSHWFDRHAV